MKISLGLENLRSLYNIGAIYRTASFFGVDTIFLIGYSGIDPSASLKPNSNKESLMHKKLYKTSLGTIDKIKTKHYKNTSDLTKDIKDSYIVALEQSPASSNIYDFKLPKNIDNLIVILGNEVTGVEQETLKICDEIVEIPGSGGHNSLNVEVASPLRSDRRGSLQISAFDGLKETDDFRQRTDQPLADNHPDLRQLANRDGFLGLRRKFVTGAIMLYLLRGLK